MKWKLYGNESIHEDGKVSLHAILVDNGTYAAYVCYNGMTFWGNYDYKTKKSAKRGAVNASLRLAKAFYQAIL
jgi:hypothetical protein